MTKGVILGLLLAAFAALALRWPELDRRPMHTDEAVNAMKFRSLWEQGHYHYDPNEHHGPALFYATLAWGKAARAGDFLQFDEAWFRRVTVCFGIGLVLLLPLVADGLGRGAAVCAGLLTAISPALVFYSRDFIHETLLVFFTFLAVAAGWRYVRSRKTGWALLTGAAVGLMQATKETFLLSLGAMVVALILNGLWRRWLDAGSPGARFKLDTRDLLTGIAAWLLVAAALFSSFLDNTQGPLDALSTYGSWMKRAAGDSPHIHPWFFYFTRLAYFHAGAGPIWSEGLIAVLAVVGIGVGFTRKGAGDSHAGLVRVLAFYTVALAAIYSLISYKTPWCLLGFWHGAILLAGVGAAALFRLTRGRGLKLAVAVLLLAAAGQLASQAWRAGVTSAADRTNPYVYAQTSPDIRELVDAVNGLSKVYPGGPRLPMKVMAPGHDYWPLPWYLRRYDQMGWWSEMPSDPFAPVMIVSTRYAVDLEERGTRVMAGIFQLRPGTFLQLYVQSYLWREYLEAKSKQPGSAP